MIATLRQNFNASFTEERYQAFLDRLAAQCDGTIPFRCAETPCFFEISTLATMAEAGRALVAQLWSQPEYLRRAAAMIPPAFRVPGGGEPPLFVQADFGLDAAGNPRLVEIQGFPSLYAFQPLLAETYQEAFDLPTTLRPYLEPRDRADYDALLGGALLGGHDPREVVLLELEPHRQKTRPDFVQTEARYGVRPVCITQVTRRGNQLFAPDGTRIRRIYNRVIVDELLRNQVTPPFDYRDDLAVEWAGHPNAYFELSKFSLPFLDHPTVPRTWFVSALETIPTDLENYVLKPLFSFAGRGVIIGPQREQLTLLSNPDEWILQERVVFVPTIDTPEGPTKVEVRIMFLRTGEHYTAMTALLRMGRGAQLGVDHNRDSRWIGASAAFTP